MEYINAYYNNNPNFKIIFTALGEEAFNTSVKFRTWPGRGRTMFKRHWKNIDKSNALLIVLIEYEENVPIKICSHYYHNKFDFTYNPTTNEGNECMFDQVLIQEINSKNTPTFIIKIVNDIL
jgi:hypothetical protein